MSAVYISPALRQLVIEQAGGRCGYCLAEQELLYGPLEFEHLQLRPRGGLTTEDNLWLACRVCNGFKSDQTDCVDPDSQKFVPLFNPRRDNWWSHFRWSDDGTEIIGTTATGRATVVALQLNTLEHMKTRRRWGQRRLAPAITACMRKLPMFLRFLLSLAFITFSTTTATATAQEKQLDDPIKALLVKYVQSINQANTTLAAEVWSTGPDVSLIHPMGHEHGWDQIKTNFYEAVMAKMFTKRDLKPKDIAIPILGDTAWVEFNWEFNATLATNQPMTTKGRETQVLQKTPTGWRILHVHYSIPFTPPAQ